MRSGRRTPGRRTRIMSGGRRTRIKSSGRRTPERRTRIKSCGRRTPGRRTRINVVVIIREDTVQFLNFLEHRWDFHVWV